MDDTDCVIAGGGPAGVMLGLLLARAGVRVVVCEKHADFLRDFRGDTVHPATMRLLDELGLGARFAALPQSRIEQIAFPTGDGGRIVVGDLRRLRTPHPYIAMVPQWDLLNLLTEAATEEPTFTIRMRTEVTGVLRDGDRITGVRVRTADGGTDEIHAALTVACDGRWSTVRRAAGMRPREFPVPIDAWWFRLPRYDGEQLPGLLPAAGRGAFLVVIPRTSHLQIAYVGRKGVDAQLRARGVEAFRRDVAAIAPWLAHRVDALTGMDDVKHLDVRVNRLRRWHLDGLLCIGDAAHAMSPVGGVGINLAVADAVAAATRLAGPLRRGRVSPAELDRVRARRALPTAAVQSVQRAMHRNLVEPILAGRRAGPPAPVLTLARRLPQVTLLPAYLIGIGPRPEHAPAFARRPATSA
ncbi:FAD-dependent oxidoreductase [Solwaraspora sp. WMMA2056]|uniref:FAD-dependent oxidoreductase n=1 Tax=Solwaraspora sp. WMMA2056 TaxID=3015161 RepID=UPI00259BEE7F|nr:FAD-dependent oxidoreductase [Solwaraspora sp. WMMA2056]WJK38476.1 FAD-dependent oxidoreductase [Solwaraspora sp. WMMA2056]